MLAWRLLRGFAGDSEVTFHGVRAKYYTGSVPASQTVPNATFYAVKYNYTSAGQRCYDTDGFHPVNTEANLTGTVSRTAGSTTITGSGTAFLSELSIGMPIRIAGGGYSIYPDVVVVRSIADDTHFTAYQAPVYSASGQVATKDSTVFVARIGGYYAGIAEAGWRANSSGIREINIAYNGWDGGISGLGSNTHADEEDFVRATPSGETQQSIPWGPTYMAEGDFMQIFVYQDSGGSLDMAFDLPGLPSSMWLVGT